MLDYSTLAGIHSNGPFSNAFGRSKLGFADFAKNNLQSFPLTTSWLRTSDNPAAVAAKCARRCLKGNAAHNSKPS